MIEKHIDKKKYDASVFDLTLLSTFAIFLFVLISKELIELLYYQNYE